MTDRIKLSDVPREAPVTLLTHRGDVRIENDCPDTVEITGVDTIHFADALPLEGWRELKATPGFMQLFRLVFPKLELSDVPLCEEGMGVRHVTGLIVLTVNAIASGKRPFWRYPEAHLHPTAQLGLCDLMVFFSKGGKT